jgi:hypothetical protein
MGAVQYNPIVSSTVEYGVGERLRGYKTLTLEPKREREIDRHLLPILSLSLKCLSMFINT